MESLNNLAFLEVLLSHHAAEEEPFPADIGDRIDLVLQYMVVFLLYHLDGIEHEVLRLRFAVDGITERHSHDEIAALLSIHPIKVRSIENSAIEKIADHLIPEKLRGE